MPVVVRYLIAILGLTVLGGGLIVGTGMLQSESDTSATKSSVTITKKPVPAASAVPVASAEPTANADMAVVDFINQGMESPSSVEDVTPDSSQSVSATDTASTDAAFASQE